jgi:hypothetical protein
MLIFLDDYRKARARCPAVQGAFGKERECVGPGALASVSAIFCFQHPCKPSPEPTEAPLSADLARLLDRIHALASQF